MRLGSHEADRATERRLRFVFGDRVVSYQIAAGATLAEVAMALEECSSRGYGEPLAIDVKLAAPPIRTSEAPVRLLRPRDSARRPITGH